MFDYFQKSLRKKLLATFIAIGFLPFLTLLVYTLLLSESKMVSKIVVEQFDRTEAVIKLVDNHLASLEKEVNFLSSLDMMDDFLAEDLDKRISRLLIQKSNDINLNLTLMAVNMDENIIASSTKSDMLGKFDLSQLTNTHGEYIDGKKLYIYSNVTASFDENKQLGFLVLEYDLDNLDMYLTHKNSIHSYIVNRGSGFTIGENLTLNLNFSKDESSVINAEHVIVYKKLSSIMSDWNIVYAVDKSVALAFLYDFIRFMLYISVVIFVLIIFVSLKYSKGIVKPIEELTAITDEITNTHNYSMELHVDSKDEIAILTHSFNTMIKTTSSALEKLEEENKLRLKRFIQLIEIFNTIIQTKNEDECIETSIKQIKILTNKSDLHFNKEKFYHADKEYISLFVTDFEKNEKLYFGSIELGLDNFEDKNEKDFYNSIASMITLQLDRIRLIDRTMSASRAKSAFISNMSHELRTPLNAIIGFTQYMIAYEELNDDQLDTMGNIESSAHYLLNMINEILDIAKIEAGKMEAHIEDVNILELVQSSHAMLQPLAKDKNINFDFIAENFENSHYKTDPKMFKQIVINLISNAIKFTQEGDVTLELYNNANTLFVSVKDSGIGIAKEDMIQLFNDFTQVENVMQKQHKGTGLGLSLSKKMANILGGDVELHSEGIGYGTISLFSIKIV
ncbi:MAG: ATP-binding protein [Campylobacterales bacterium]|nr:ATP-binding protein [Campylobacterales bacterium]